jgi:hypothetical protein
VRCRLHRRAAGDHEFEACDMLESYAENEKVSKEIWLALRDAAAKMQLSERAGG